MYIYTRTHTRTYIYIHTHAHTDRSSCTYAMAEFVRWPTYVYHTHTCDMTHEMRLSWYAINMTWLSGFREWVTMCQVTRINGSSPTDECVMSYVWMSARHCERRVRTRMALWILVVSHVTGMNASCRTYEWVMLHVWVSQVTLMNEWVVFIPSWFSELWEWVT